MTAKRELSDKAIDIIGNWWFDIFLGPKHDMGARGENEEQLNAAASGLAGILARKHPVEEDQRPIFLAALRAQIRKEIGEGKRLIGLGTDYHPEATLAEAMKEAGINESRRAWKISVSISNRGIQIGPGYQAPLEMLCDLEGNVPTQRWVLKYKWEGYEVERWSITYSYSEYEHHGQVASRIDRSEYKHPTYEEWFEELVVDETCDDPDDCHQRSWQRRDMPLSKDAVQLNIRIARAEGALCSIRDEFSAMEQDLDVARIQAVIDILSGASYG